MLPNNYPLLFLCIFLATGFPFLASAKPNILLIYTDDQGSIDAQCYGAGDLRTPAMDKLARQGVRFTQMLAPAAVCSPSRAGLLSGRIPMRVGAPGNIYQDLPHPRDRYAAFLSSTDELIGQVLDHLEAAGKTGETVVVFQSDHGHSVEERTFGGGGNSGPYRGHKFSLFEGGQRVPSIVSWPGTLPQGEVRDQFVTGCDWFPTLAQWASARIPDDLHLDGKNIDPVIRSADAPSPHSHFFWTQDFSGDKDASWAVRAGDWKLLHRPLDTVDRFEKTPDYFLVNLVEDVGERANLAPAKPAKLAELQGLAEEYKKSLLPDFQAARK